MEESQAALKFDGFKQLGGAARKVSTYLNRVPAIRRWRERRYEKQFNGLYGSFLGVFASFQEAQRAAPASKPFGFDSPQFAEKYGDRFDRIFDYDYPVLFWLRSLLRPDLRLFDVGGHVGEQCYAYERFLRYPAGLSWQVMEVPEIARRGEQLAAERGRKDLSFSSQFEDGDGAEVLLAAGSLHYLPEPGLLGALRKYKRLPPHLILNKLPLHGGSTFVTLQNAGASFVPQYVFNRAEFIKGYEALGYRVLDAWNDRIHSCHIPFRPELSLTHYSGLYLRHRSSEPDLTPAEG